MLCAASSVATLAAVDLPSPTPLARFANGETITDDDLSDYLDRRVDLQGGARNAWGVEGVVREMATTRVYDLEGKRLGVERAKREGSPERFDDIYADAVFTKLAPVCPQPANEQEARQYFNQHPEAFQLPVRSRLQRLMLPADIQVDGKPAMDWLLAQAQAISTGSTKFADVAQHAKDLYTEEPQGELGWVSLEDDGSGSAIMQALRNVQPGQMLGPVRDGGNVYLFLVVARQPQRQLTWDEAKSSAAQRAVSYCRAEAVSQGRAQLFKQYGVVIDREAIRELFAKAGRRSGTERAAMDEARRARRAKAAAPAAQASSPQK